MMQGDWWPMPWFGMIFGPIIMIIVLVIAGMIVVALMRSLGGGPLFWQQSDSRPSRRALEILEERFAKGEIQKDEFEEKKRLLLSR